MADNVAVPYYEDGDRITGQATGAAVVGKTFVDIAGDRTTDGLISIVTATAAGDVFGVASHDAADGENVTVLRGGSMVVPVTAAGAITAGAEVEVGATGKATALAAGTAVGRAVADAADGEDAQIALYR